MARNSVCKTAILFVFGGLAYFGLEVLFRGHSHWTMFVLGGFLFLILGELNDGLLEWDTPLIWQGVLGSAIVTGTELITGMILNVWLGLGVWHYSGMPFNYKGQICLPFSILWIFVSIAAIVLDDWLRYLLFGEERPRYTLFRRGESRGKEPPMTREERREQLLEATVTLLDRGEEHSLETHCGEPEGYGAARAVIHAEFSALKRTDKGDGENERNYL